MNFKFNLVGIDEGETKLNCTIEMTDVDPATAIQMGKRLSESPEQIKAVIKTAYECFGAEQKRQFDARLELERDELNFRKERAEKDDWYKERNKELEAKVTELQDKLWNSQK